MTDPQTDRELIAEANYLIEQAESFLVNAEPLGEVAPHSIIGLWLRTADALEAMTKEMHARELHHFEEEQKSAGLGARIGNAIVAVETDEPPHVIIGMLRGELRWNHNTPERKDES